MIYIVQFLIMFVYVFLKGFQHQNVIGGKYVSAFILSYLMAGFEVACITFVVKQGWYSVLPVGTGAALGIILSMYIYRRLNPVENT